GQQTVVQRRCRRTLWPDAQRPVDDPGRRRFVLGGVRVSRSRPSGGPAQNQKPEGDMTMRFMMPVKSAENSGPPPKELMDAIGKVAEEALKAGTMLHTGGLAPTAMSTRV